MASFLDTLLPDYPILPTRPGYADSGIRVRRTKRGAVVVELDWWADPNRNREWAAKMRALIGDTDFEREYCVRSSCRVLTADLQWIEAGKLQAGEEIVGFDENLHGYFKYRRGIIQSIRAIKSPPVRVITDRSSIIVSRGHKFVVRSNVDVPRHVWRAAEDLRKDDLILFFGFPWELESTYSAGWLAGLLDGEGHLSNTEVAVSQNEGPILQEAREALSSRGFPFYEGSQIGTNCKTLRVGRTYETMRLLGSVRPIRLLANSGRIWEDKAVIDRTHTRYARVVTAATGRVPESFVSVQTSTKTLITEGYLSHNCRNWTIAAGTAFYPEFKERFEQRILACPKMLNGPIYRGWDFGYRRPAVVWFQYSPISHRIWILREIMPNDIDIWAFRDLVMYLSGTRTREQLQSEPRALEWAQKIDDDPDYPNTPWFTDSPSHPNQFIDWAGPEANYTTSIVKKDQPEKSYAEVLASASIHLGIRGMEVYDRTTIVRKLLHFAPDGFPYMLIDPACPITIKMFKGGLAFKAKTNQNPMPNEPAKDGFFDNIHDALGYGVCNVAELVTVEEADQHRPPAQMVISGNRDIDMRRPDELANNSIALKEMRGAWGDGF